ncbi:hypothetical protein J6590_063485 [Homalodisca vitripennis]|nr:hypothetical protein J6590_063485 [Homalodisca vitripennis]
MMVPFPEEFKKIYVNDNPLKRPAKPEGNTVITVIDAQRSKRLCEHAPVSAIPCSVDWIWLMGDKSPQDVSLEKRDIRISE